MAAVAFRRLPPVRAFPVVLALVTGACTVAPTALRPTPATALPRIALCEKACRDSVELTYLGVGGFVIRHGTSAVMTAPSFTHPGLLRLMLPSPFRLAPDTALVDRQLGSVASSADVSSILVGHAHYDHLLDVPYVARRWTPEARIYGSPTMAHILAGDPALRGRAHAIADSAGSAAETGRWIYPAGGGIRFMPLRSSHAPNAGHYTFAEGTLRADRSSLPRTARGWVKGEVLAYLIDVVAADSTPLFRLYYQDAAADSASVTLPPLTGRDVRAVDVAIICVGNYDAVPRNPALLLGALRPRHVVLSHWEDFFRSPRDPLRVVPLTDARRLAAQLTESLGESWTTPEPLTRLTVHF